MKLSRLFILACMCVCVDGATADVLTTCQQNEAFHKREANEIRQLQNRQSKYDANSGGYLALQAQIDQVHKRFDKYGELLCGQDGLPHLITDGDWRHAREFTIPAILFLYITGWIGWVGRSYLQYTKQTKNPTEQEIILDLPMAFKYMLSGFLWPLSAWQEYRSGKLLAKEDEISVSPR
nr:photosystem I subunit III [Cyanidiococcus yangmingshanensis]